MLTPVYLAEALMPKVKNTRDTVIYWLLDTRPETMAAGWPLGEPFYCGKTVRSTAKRLVSHRSSAAHNPHGRVGARLLECGDFVRIETMEVVPPDQDWRERERHWIRLMRGSFPGAVNVSDGGDGPVGWVPNAEQRAKMSDAGRGRKHAPETRVKMSTSHSGKAKTLEARANMRAAQIGKKHSAETRAKMSTAKKGCTFGPRGPYKPRQIYP